MDKIHFTLTSLSIAIAIHSLPIQTSNAQTPPRGTFTPTQDCPATKTIAGENPGNVRVGTGKTYDTYGFNYTTRTHILLKIVGANPERRWVKSSCGNFQASSSPVPDPSSTQLLPFFDDLNNPIAVKFPAGAKKDITPPAPKLEPFDQRIIAMCGEGFNAPVREQDFKKLLQDYPDVFSKLKDVTGGAIKPNRSMNANFTEDLVQIWFGQEGFKHIFCGETGSSGGEGRIANLDGLHFYGRYLQLQDRSNDIRAGRYVSTERKEEVVDGVIYSFGVRVIKGNEIIAESSIKGYPYNLNAQEILINATKAYKINKSQEEKSACLYTVSKPNTAPFQAVFVKKKGAIRTFYPDATPDGIKCGG